MKEPKHVYINAQWSERPLQAYEDEDGWDVPPSRYTLTRGEEWDALMRDAREARSFVDAPPAVEVVALRWAVDSLLAYFGEQS